MAPNRYREHLVVMTEDEANRSILNGFRLHPSLDPRRIISKTSPGGWTRTLEYFQEEYSKSLRQYPKRMVLIVIDFDNAENRLAAAQEYIAEEYIERVFVLGSLKEAEDLKGIGKKRHSLEDVGRKLADDCVSGNEETWKHELLRHNRSELDRLIDKVKPFLFLNG